ncbi:MULTISPECIES: helix-turn-helix domain-containing protein [unclassified Gordonia (in: high G+C Gram-positive bacteria)]|uniref:helix-turn-helix domain-containing protein n=1 Tax=Gordonia sp. B7-2 TaxID=3420932 RepID=UPI003D92D26C
MQELLGRIAALDPTASLGLRVIACFDELIVGQVNIHGLLATAAALAGCPAGCSFGPRVSPLGETLAGDPPTGRLSHGVDSDAAVWLERAGPEEANDAIILERLALAVGIRRSGANPDAARRDIAVLLGRDHPVDERSEAAARLGLSPSQRYRVLTQPLFAEWASHPNWPSDVISTSLGTIHTLIAPASVTADDAPAAPCGLGVTGAIPDLALSFRTALIALRLCERPASSAVDAERYGGLIHMLAESPSTATNPDVDRLETLLTEHTWASATIVAVIESSSARQAARSLDIHHSTMQVRVETLSGELGFDPFDGLGKARLGVAYLAWRMRHSRALELPPPQ